MEQKRSLSACAERIRSSRGSEQSSSDHSDGSLAPLADTIAGASSFLRVGGSTMQLRFTAAIAVFSTACGARSGLGVSETDEIRDAADGRDARDAAVARDATDAADAPVRPCDRLAPAGAVVWRTPLPTGVTFTGPPP